MKNVLINKNLFFIFAFFLIVVGCKKSDEVTPALLTGKWKQNGVTGKYTVTENGKAEAFTINEPADNSIIEFKPDGTALLDGSQVKYSLSGSNLAIGEGTQSVTFIAKVNGSNLTLSFTKDEFFKFFSLLLDPNDPDFKEFLDAKNKISAFEFNQNYIKQ
jgi:hypothetical protein